MSVADGHTPEFAEWYGRAMDDARARFEPLAGELERLLEIKTTVDQTGGMVMCLRVPVGRELDENGETLRYAYFSELDELGVHDVGFGLYEGWDDGEYHDWPGEADCYFPGCQPCEWRTHPELAEAVARWAAPMIVAFAAGRRTT